MSAVVKECRIHNCVNRNPDATCRLPTININSLTMCNSANTKTRQHKPRDWSPNSVGRTVDQ